ncbi:putative FHA domain-interacting nucleolar phosphoprotein, partial [Tribonema minus]
MSSKLQAVLQAKVQAKLEALQSPQWASSDEEGEAGAPAKPVVAKAKPKRKKSQALAKSRPEAVGEGRVVYLGHIPHGFYEEAMNGFFSQFGEVRRLKLARSRKSGRSRGYAFLEFTHPEVASIVAETMNGYFLFERKLVCNLVAPSKVGDHLFKGADDHLHYHRRLSQNAMVRHIANRQRTPEEDASHQQQALTKAARKQAKLAALGIEYDLP